jgi:hypothetical protein
LKNLEKNALEQGYLELFCWSMALSGTGRQTPARPPRSSPWVLTPRHASARRSMRRSRNRHASARLAQSARAVRPRRAAQPVAALPYPAPRRCRTRTVPPLSCYWPSRLAPPLRNTVTPPPRHRHLQKEPSSPAARTALLSSHCRRAMGAPHVKLPGPLLFPTVQPHKRLP